ncbi:MAG: ATP-binding cassette domain-containing protein [Hespellia sp.]|nr:ATP-binding cassette domain-containing protein [Hespellia sp.]
MKLEVDIRKNLGDFRLDVQLKSQSSRIGILGASGSGKSMLLKSLAGIETPDVGRIQIGENVFFDSSRKRNIKPQIRRVGYLFQNYALFPRMTVEKNIEAGLRGDREQKRRRVLEMMEKFQISDLAGRLPSELSGGQQQRVALARIMAYQPDVVLLDEPFAALDMYLKDRLQQEMADMLKDYPGIVILVSHSRDEIYRFSEELLVMQRGASLILGRTKEIFEDPRFVEAARLTGCRNFSRIRRLDVHTVEAADWGIVLHFQGDVPEWVVSVGYRAHDFVPLWGERTRNCLKLRVESLAQVPFEWHYYVLPEKDTEEKSTLCWFVQQKSWRNLEERGMPDYLQLEEEKILFLKDSC